MDRDVASTVAGGGAGLLLLQQVHWESIPYGEAVKVGVALILIGIGCALYSKRT